MNRVVATASKDKRVGIFDIVEGSFVRRRFLCGSHTSVVKCVAFKELDGKFNCSEIVMCAPHGVHIDAFYMCLFAVISCTY